MGSATLLSLVLTALVSYLVALALGPWVIPALRRLKFGQVIRADGPARHLQKQGTPTMGGVIFLGGMAGGTTVALLAGWLRPTPQLGLALGVAAGYGLIGFADDYIKVALKRPLGLRAREKLLAQVLLALALGYAAAQVLNLGTWIRLPFWHWTYDLGWLYLVLAVLVVVGFANAVNLTDGLDGLAGGASALAYGTYLLVALAAARDDLALWSAAVVGGVLGFLHYNRPPARVFMGDTGSMALGGGLGALAVLTRTELLLPVVGGLFVVETLSVIIQVFSFHTLGRRVFRMSPLHHHFELAGWSESQVVNRFWLVATAFALLGIAGLQGLGR